MGAGPGGYLADQVSLDGRAVGIVSVGPRSVALSARRCEEPDNVPGGILAFLRAGQPLSAVSHHFEESKEWCGRENARWQLSIASARLTA